MWHITESNFQSSSSSDVSSVSSSFLVLKGKHSSTCVNERHHCSAWSTAQLVLGLGGRGHLKIIFYCISMITAQSQVSPQDRRTDVLYWTIKPGRDKERLERIIVWQRSSAVWNISVIKPSLGHGVIRNVLHDGVCLSKGTYCSTANVFTVTFKLYLA